MPLYEYICEQDGTVIELIRPMAQADSPVDDPAGRGRVFKRQHSTFQAGSSSGSLPMAGGGGGSGGCCLCGKVRGSCTNN